MLRMNNYFHVWVESIKHAWVLQGKAVRDLKIKVESNGYFHQASLTVSGLASLFGEPALGEDNAMKALLDEVNNLVPKD